MSFDFNVIVEALPFLARGMGLSLLLTLLAATGGIVLAVLLALMRLSGILPLQIISAAYVNFFRSMPLILVIFWFFFLVPFVIGRPVGGFYSALIAFTLFEAAYYSEIVRAGIQSVPKGQVSAAYATGLTYPQSMRFIVLPQAFRAMTPVLLTQAIVLFQDTSLVYVVSLRDFMTATTIVARNEGRLIEMYLFAAAVYFVICLAGSLYVRRLQRKHAR